MALGILLGSSSSMSLAGKPSEANPNFPSPAFHKDFAGTRTLGADVTFTRASNATYTNSAGVITAATTDEARFDFDPVTRICRGLLIEEARTNLLLNSTIDGANLVTQNITTTAAARTLSFYGSGTVTLSGTHSATVVGTGAYPTRTTYTYTPTAGTLTLTVSGTVQFANDELGAFATSFIPTDGTAKTRAADVCSVTGANFSAWFSATEGTFVVKGTPMSLAGSPVFYEASDGTANERMRVSTFSDGNANAFYVDGGVNQAVVSGGAGTFVTNTTSTVATAYKVNDFATSAKGGTVSTDTSGTLPTVNRLGVGNDWSQTAFLNGRIARITYYNKRLSDSILRGLSA